MLLYKVYGRSKTLEKCLSRNLFWKKTNCDVMFFYKFTICKFNQKKYLTYVDK